MGSSLIVKLEKYLLEILVRVEHMVCFGKKKVSYDCILEQYCYTFCIDMNRSVSLVCRANVHHLILPKNAMASLYILGESKSPIDYLPSHFLFNIARTISTTTCEAYMGNGTLYHKQSAESVVLILDQTFTSFYRNLSQVYIHAKKPRMNKLHFEVRHNFFRLCTRMYSIEFLFNSQYI